MTSLIGYANLPVSWIVPLQSQLVSSKLLAGAKLQPLVGKLQSYGLMFDLCSLGCENKPKMAYSRDSFIEIRERQERENLGNVP